MHVIEAAETQAASIASHARECVPDYTVGRHDTRGM